MSINVTKRQHVVNRKYLTKWNNKNSKLFCLFEDNEIKEINAKNICVYNFFYKINSLNSLEKDLILQNFGDDGRKVFIANNNDGKNVYDLICFYQQLERKKYPLPIFELVDSLVFAGYYKRLIDEGKLKLLNSEDIKNFYNEGVESVHTFYESLGFPFLEELYNHSYSNLEKYLSNFIPFLCVQYFRTNKIKQDVINYVGSEINIENSWTLFNLFASIKISNNMLQNTLKLEILHNQSKIQFITGDQPIINIKAQANKKETKELEFYYPISPGIALKVIPEFNNIKKYSISHRYVDKDEVNKLNRLLKMFCTKIFANNIIDLELYK